MVDCQQLLEGYSAYRDEELDEHQHADFAAHLRACASCARYDRLITEGVRIYQRSAELEPSDDFLPRLQHRIYSLENELRGPGRTGSGTQAALLVGIAATLAAVAWLPAAQSSPAVLQLQPVAARAPLPVRSTPPRLLEPEDLLFPAAHLFGGPVRQPELGQFDDHFFRTPSTAPEFRVHPVSQR